MEENFMEEDMKKLAELVGSKKNYTTKTHEEIKELYMKYLEMEIKKTKNFLIQLIYISFHMD